MYKIKEGFVLREVGGTSCVVPVGKASNDFKGIINLNGTGAFLFKKLQTGITEEDLVDELLKEYNVDKEIAKRDVHSFIQKLLDGGIIE